MALTWTDDMGNLAFELALEQPTRDAALAAIAFAAALPADQQPVFDGDVVICPCNESAEALLVELGAQVPADIIGARRQTVFATAVAAMRGRSTQPTDEAFVEAMKKQKLKPSHHRPKQTTMLAGRR